MSGVVNALCALNKIKNVDKAFFIICAVIIALIVAVYFLIPVLNKKFYQEQKDNLRKREAAFKSNLKSGLPSADAKRDAEAEAPEVTEDK